MLLKPDNLQDLQSLDTTLSRGFAPPDPHRRRSRGFPAPLRRAPRARLRHKIDRLSQRVVTNSGPTVVGHTTLPSGGRQPPKVQDRLGFRTFWDERCDDPRKWDRHE